MYLAAIMDLYSRIVVGWSMSTRMTRRLVLDALEMVHCITPTEAVNTPAATIRRRYKPME
jgi:hypothetical protein